MANTPIKYDTSSDANSDLNGYMYMDGNTVTKYHSNDQGDATSITMKTGDGLHFTVQFPTPVGAKPYKISAKRSAFQGDSSEENDPEGGQDDWEATAVPPQPEGN